MDRDLKPPPELVARVAGDAGDRESFLWSFERLGGLRPEEDVLDVGCGVGRAALALAGWLTGRYEGFDVDPELIGWCRENITLPNFNFTDVDLYSSAYNRDGKLSAADFTFPYEDGSFDFAFGISIFTHLLPEALENYLAELHRVLRDGGRTFFTFFLLSPRHRERLKAGGVPAEAFLANYQGDFSTPYERPEDLVAYRQGYVREGYERNGFEVTGFRWGDWPEWATGRQETYTQDLVLARK